MARPCGHGLLSIHFGLDRSAPVGLKGPWGEERGTEDLSSELPGLALLCPPTLSALQCEGSAILQVFTKSMARSEFLLEPYRDSYKNLCTELGSDQSVKYLL